jgi:hypothetical protein
MGKVDASLRRKEPVGVISDIRVFPLNKPFGVRGRPRMVTSQVIRDEVQYKSESQPVEPGFQFGKLAGLTKRGVEAAGIDGVW